MQFRVGDDASSFQVLGLGLAGFQVGKTHKDLDSLLPLLGFVEQFQHVNQQIARIGLDLNGFEVGGDGLLRVG